VALILSLGISFLMTRKYTAVVSIAIDPPASSDPRAATAISPIYLESLKTYESYAEGDQLFERAVNQFHLRASSEEAVETLKRRILRVSKLKDSKILQIRVTLPDPQCASDVARFIADEVLALSRKTGQGIDQEMRRNAETQLSEWESRHNRALKQLDEFNAKWPVEPLQAEIDSLQDVAGRVLRSAIDAEGDAEDSAAREKIAVAGGGDAENLKALREEAAARRARAVVLQRQARELQQSLAPKQTELGKRMATRAQFEDEVRLAQGGLEAESKHTRDIRDSAGGRGDVLTVIDPGIVPQRPSSPNIALNGIVCVFAAFVLSLFYLVVTFARMRTWNEHVRA
jgi:capsule polysaccharide export protein KpsE/RkpR